MEVQEAQKRKQELEQAIGELLSQFERDTGCSVGGVDLERVTMLFGGRRSEAHSAVAHVKVEVSL